MDSEDYIAELGEEARSLRRQVVELEDELRQVREDLMIALDRKVEEVSPSSRLYSVSMSVTNGGQMDEGLPPEDNGHLNRPKKEEKGGTGLGVTVTKHQVKQEVKPRKSVSDAYLLQ